MAIVGIIANPASGKDIRRVVGHALVVSNREKSSIVRRILVGLHAVGIDDVRIMPDKFGIGDLAINELQNRWTEVVKGVQILDMDFTGTGIDSILAARELRGIGANCIITLGGDGTTRLVAKESGDIPLLPVSTGTNNVLPMFIEGTVAGLAAGYIAHQEDPHLDGLSYRHKRIDIMVNHKLVDSALVDVAAVDGSFSGSKAVWETDAFHQIFVTRASPASIGISSFVGLINPISPRDPFGAVAILCAGSGCKYVTAPVGPGLMATLPLQEIIRLEPDIPFPVMDDRPLMLTLDGEREVYVGPDDVAEIILRTDGPWIVDVERVMQLAAEKQFFINLPK